jgi:hypothetical protein
MTAHASEAALVFQWLRIIQQEQAVRFQQVLSNNTHMLQNNSRCSRRAAGVFYCCA